MRKPHPDPDDTRLPEQHCPNCNELLTGSASFFDPHSRPKEGDANICVYCAAVLVFNADLTSHPATDAELAEFRADEGSWQELRTTQDAIRRAIAHRRRRHAWFSTAN